MGLIKFTASLSAAKNPLEIEPREGIKVALVWGQSNIDGRVPGANLPVDCTNPTSKIKIYDGKFISWDYSKPPAMFTYSDQYGADTIMFQRLSDDLGETMYVAKKSRGGTAVKQSSGGVGDWNVKSHETVDHYRVFIGRINNTKNYIEQILGKTFIPTFIWADIGETDSLASNKPSFKTDFKNTIAGIRAASGDLNLPVVHRELGLYQSGVQQWMIDAQNEFKSEISNYYLIPNTGFTLMDSYHLDAESTEDYADQVRTLVKAKGWYN